MAARFSRVNGVALTKRMLISAGAEPLAGILLDLAASDPALMERIRGRAEAFVSATDNGEAEPPSNSAATNKASAEEAMVAERAAQDEGESYMVGSSPAMRRIYETIRKVARTDAPVLITGESGTGKELAAQAIHERSTYSDGPFVPINCAALPTNLIASELFGHEKGAFTGADQRRIGRIQSAEGGTVFLDEIGDLPLDLQAHLLRFLQEKTIDRVGGRHPIKVDVRVVAATNADLRKAVADGKFREDLFYRLNVLTLEMPPLRERGDDIELVSTFFMRKFADEMGRSIRGLRADAQRLIQCYPWPGNIRELIATMRRAVVMADGDWIRAEDLGLPEESAGPDGDIPSLEAARRRTEEGLIRKALDAHGNNIKRTAEHLGVSRVTLYRLIEKYGIATGSEMQH